MDLWLRINDAIYHSGIGIPIEIELLVAKTSQIVPMVHPPSLSFSYSTGRCIYYMTGEQGKVVVVKVRRHYFSQKSLERKKCTVARGSVLISFSHSPLTVIINLQSARSAPSFFLLHLPLPILPGVAKKKTIF